MAESRKAISIDTSPDHGSVFLVEYFAGLAKRAGLNVDIQKSEQPDRDANLIIWSHHSQDRPLYLLQSHLDTVDPGPYGLWTETERNPFQATIKGDRLYGLGATDGKLDFICKLSALVKFHSSGRPSAAGVVGTFGGETMEMTGAELLMDHPMVKKAKGFIVGAPTDMHLVQAANGAVVFEVFFPFSEHERTYRKQQEGESTSTHSRLFQGKAAHSSTPHLGESAIKKLMDYLRQLPDRLAIINLDGGKNYNSVPAEAFLEIDLSGGFADNVGKRLSRFVDDLERIETDFVRFPAEGFNPSMPTSNLGLLRTQADGILLGVSWRIPPSVSPHVVDEWLTRVQQSAQEGGANYILKRRLWPYSVASDCPLTACCLDELKGLIGNPRAFQKSASTEASVFFKKGLRCVVMGPGTSENNSHRPNEFNNLSQLNQAAEFYSRILERLSS